jgi:hypothetical protein
MASGLPPKVVPCTPVTMPLAASAVVRQAPIGKPPPSALAIAMMSGSAPGNHWWANSLPVRPMPLCTSSWISSTPCSRVRRRSSSRNSPDSARTALALHRLDDHRRRGRAGNRLGSAPVVDRHLVEAGQARAEPFEIGGIARGVDRAIGASVERTGKADHVDPLGLPLASDSGARS